MAVLPDIEYPVELASTGRARLENGFFEETIAPGSASRTRISLGKEMCEGDLNGDGSPDAAAILIGSSGGTGTFTYLTAVVNDKGTARPVAAVLLGDRIVVKSVTIDSGEITVRLLTRSEQEPMASPPTVATTRTFRLRGTDLTE
jgi:hypothetical protein